MFSWIKKVLFAVTVSLNCCISKVGQFCPNSIVLRDQFFPTVEYGCSTVVQSSVKQCNGLIHVTSSTTKTPNTELSHPNLISIRDIHNHIRGLVAQDKNVPIVSKG